MGSRISQTGGIGPADQLHCMVTAGNNALPTLKEPNEVILTSVITTK